MPKACSVCTREQRSEIDTLIRNHATSLRSIGRRFGFSIQTALRHRHHLDQDSTQLVPIRMDRRHLSRDRRLSTKANIQAGQGTRARERFLEAYAATGCVSTAAKVAGIARSRVYAWLEVSDEFAEAFRLAGHEATDALEQEAWRRATGYEEPVYQRGKQVGVITRYSDQLLMLLLKARAPDKYRDRMDISVAPIIKAVAGFDPSDVL